MRAGNRIEVERIVRTVGRDAGGVVAYTREHFRAQARINCCESVLYSGKSNHISLSAMPTFVAYKIHYDHRPSLTPYLKYSVVATAKEYDKYLKRYRNEKVGGNGFHECLNFAVGGDGAVRFYLPPTCMPAQGSLSDEFVFFSFTYRGDAQLPAHVVGVHAGAHVLSTKVEGLLRGAPFEIDGVEPLVYHAQAPADLVTLLNPPLPYVVRDGRYMPPLERWGNGLRYLTKAHASNIIQDAMRGALAALKSSDISRAEVLERQIEVLQRISDRYSLGVTSAPRRTSKLGDHSGGSPDTEIGYQGERFVYMREVERVQKLGWDASEVQWVSQVDPASKYDIRTLRQTASGIRSHFLEVKSSKMADGENVYVSARQVEFFAENADCATFVFVNYGTGKKPTVRELTLDELKAEFDLLPIKYRLVRN